MKEMLTNKESEKYVDVAALFNVHVADPKPMVRKAAVTVFDAMIPFLIEKVRIFLGHALGSGGVGVNLHEIGIAWAGIASLVHQRRF